MGDALASVPRVSLTSWGDSELLPSKRAPFRITAGVVVFVLFAITVVSFVVPRAVTVSHNHFVNIAISTASLLVALGAAFFLITDFLLYGRLASFYVGYAFLVFGGASLGSGLLPLLLGWDAQMHFVPYGWALQRVVGAMFLFAASLLVDRQVAPGRRRQLVYLGVALTVALVVSGTTGIFLASGARVPGGFQTALQMTSCILLFSASVLFWRASREGRGPGWFVWLPICLAVAGFGELQYAFHQYVPEATQLGDLMRLSFYSSLLLALGFQWSRGYKRLHLQTRELEALHALMTPPSVQDVPGIIRHVVDVVGRALAVNARVVMADRLEPHADALSRSVLMSDVSAPSEGLDPMAVVVAFEDGSVQRTEFGVPLTAGHRRLGMLVVDRGEFGEFDQEDVRLLRSFGSQASVLLERSLLYEEVAAGAVLEERSRLAREIHDGLAQHIAFLKMRVAWLKRSPSKIVLSDLVDIEGVLETALAEARQAISTLRSVPTGTSIGDAIASYAEEFGHISGLAVDIDTPEELPEIGPKARIELLRVVQEALNNIRKHALARSVTLTMKEVEGSIEIVVKDDGRGFVLDDDFSGHFGMDIMNERAQSIGALLRVTSAPDSGTEVRIRVPAVENDRGSPRGQSA